MVKKLLHITFRPGFLFTCLLLTAFSAGAQFRISGTVIDDKSKPVRGANVYLDNTIDGGTTDSMGIFTFTTSEKGNQTIIATEVSHATAGQPIVINGDMSGIVITIKANKAHDLEGVVITAGSFGGLNDKTKTVLNPLDIVTTAGSNADVVKAIEMLPGTQKTGTDNGMFVRGGEANEAAIIVDEMIVQNAFFSGPPGVTTRSRFNAFQYQGVSFSSGGYSARYGQALSGVLELNTIDLAEKSTINLGAHLAGIYASGTKRWKNSSFDAGANYTNLTPFYGIATSNYKFYNPPTGGGGNMRYVWKPNKNGILKISANATFFSSGIAIPNPAAGSTDSSNVFFFQPDTVNYVTDNQNYYTNVSYKQLFKSKYTLYTAASYSFNKDKNKFGTIPINANEHRAQYRIECKDYINSRVSLLVGSDVQNYGTERTFISDTLKQKFTETIVSGYAELDWSPNNRIAIRPGVRYEHSTFFNIDNIAPRLSLAFKTGVHTQASLAGGIFFQDPDNSYLLYGYNKLQMQQATHVIANWQYSHNNRTLRVEGYYKNYDKLVSETGAIYNPNLYYVMYAAPGNLGTGYAQGFELFWRDKKTFKNVDYWLSYSFIDTKRKYGRYPVEATPPYISNHNLNLVGKYFVDKWQTNFSLTYSYATGRPYYNPTSATFLGDRAPDYHNLALAVAYLHTFGRWFTVFYVSIDNVTDNHNVFGYRYTSTGRKDPIVPALYRTVFFGVNMSLTKFDKDEL